MNLYAESWKLYKAHSESFLDDLQYYMEFCKGYRSLEIFAGYGRLTNLIAESGSDIECLELSPDFSKHILLPESRKHVCDVLKFDSNTQYQRIFAGYNSFCLLNSADKQRAFFRILEEILTDDGKISLSYYHPDYWHLDQPSEFLLDGNKITCSPSFDLSDREHKQAVWIDSYTWEGGSCEHRYPVYVIENQEELEALISPTSLTIEKVIFNYNNEKLKGQGWVEYLLKRR